MDGLPVSTVEKLQASGSEQVQDMASPTCAADQVQPEPQTELPEYLALLRRAEAPGFDQHRSQVLKDIPRTLPKHPRFAVQQNVEPSVPDAATGRLRVTWRVERADDLEPSLVEPLVNVLMTVVAVDPGAGYTQGLNFIAATLLLKYDEATTFARLEALIRLYPGFYARDVNMGRSLQVEQVERGVLDAMCAHTPAGRHIQQVGPNLLSMCASQWLLPLFSNVLPDPAAALHVLEFIGSSSCPNVLTRLTLAMLQLHETEILECQDLDTLHELLTQLPSTIANVSALCALAISSELVGCDKIASEESTVIEQVKYDMAQRERRERAHRSFKAVDTNGDRQLGFDEFKQILLLQSDVNHRAIQKSISVPVHEGDEDDALARALFDRVDTDQSGEISFHEFSRVSSRVGHFAKQPATHGQVGNMDDGGTLHRQHSTFDWATGMFASVDLDGDGSISKSELHDLARNIYCARDGLTALDGTGSLRELTPVQELEVQRVFDAADADNSGQIDRDEFIAAARSTPFLLTGLQLLSVEAKLEQEEKEKKQMEAQTSVLAQQQQRRTPKRPSRFCICISAAAPKPVPNAEEGEPPVSSSLTDEH
jgi:Ca2+-binding EF-hand superfamily protein